MTYDDVYLTPVPRAKKSMTADIRHLTPNDLPLMDALLRTFGEAFNDVDTYTVRNVQVRTT